MSDLRARAGERSRGVAASLTAIVVAATLTACTGGKPGPTVVTPGPKDTPWSGASSPAPGPRVTADAGSTDQLLTAYGPAPLSVYNVVGEDVETLLKAQDALVGACMAQRGFTYEPDERTVSAIGANDWEAFLGLTDLVQARASGYRTAMAPGDQDRQAQAEAAITANADLSPERLAYLQALRGQAYVAIIQGQNPGTDAQDEDACLPGAQRQLTPAGAAPNVNIQADLFDEAQARAVAAPQVEAAVTAWRGCMGDQGYALNAIPRPNQSAEVSQSNIDQAVADVTCKNSTGLTDAYITALYMAEKSAIEEHLSDVQAFADYTEERLRIAAQVLSDAG